MKYAAIALSTGLIALTSTAFAEPAKITGTVIDVFGPRFVLETANGRVLVDIGPKGAGKVAIKPGDKIEIDGDRNQNEIRARRLTLANGHAYEMHKRTQSWREWLVGKRTADATGPFGAAEARKIATDKGYQVTGEPVATKKHFEMMGEKGGRSFELRVHRDGKVEERIAFGAAEAKKIAVDKGYQLTSEPVARKDHFRATATKSGKAYDVDLHRDGRVVEQAAFGVVEAKKLVSDQGYDLVGEMRPVDAHFELLAKKDGKFFELHAHRDGKLVRARSVDATDAKWGTFIR